VGQSLAMLEARVSLAMLLARFEFGVAPEMGSVHDVRAAEVMRLTLQCSKGIQLLVSPRTGR
jgi:cytochrome P450